MALLKKRTPNHLDSTEVSTWLSAAERAILRRIVGRTLPLPDADRAALLSVDAWPIYLTAFDRWETTDVDSIERSIMHRRRRHARYLAGLPTD